MTKPARYILIALSVWLQLAAIPVFCAGGNDSLQAILNRKETNDSTRVLALVQLGYARRKVSTDTAMAMLADAMRLADKTGFDRGLSQASRHTGLIYYVQGDYAQAMSYFQKAFDAAKKVNALREASSALNNIALIHKVQGNHIKALEDNFTALRLREQLNDDALIASSYNNISNIYLLQEKYEKSLEYAKKAMEIRIRLKLYDDLSLSYNNISDIYYLLGKKKEAMDILRLSLDLSEKQKDFSVMSLAATNMAQVLIDGGKLDEAFVFLQKSKLATEKAEFQDRQAYYLGVLAEYHVKKGQNEAAYQTAEEAYGLAKKIGHIEFMQKSAMQKSLAAENMGKTAEALVFYKEYIALHDSISNDKKAKMALSKDFEYQEQKLKLEQEKKDLAHAAELEKEKLLRNASVFGFFMMLALAFISYRFYSVKKKSNLLLEEQNNKIKMLLRELHHRVKNNLQVVSDLLELQSVRIDDETAKKALLESQQRVQAMSLIHSDLYYDGEVEFIDMPQYMAKLVGGLLQSFGYGDKISEVLELEVEDSRMHVNTALPLGLIVNELVINSLKYAFPKTENPKLRLSIKTEAESLWVTLADNGPGLPEGVNPKTGKSFGLKLIKSLLKQLKGTMETQNAPEGGLVFLLEIKNHQLQ